MAASPAVASPEVACPAAGRRREAGSPPGVAATAEGHFRKAAA